MKDRGRETGMRDRGKGRKIDSEEKNKERKTDMGGDMGSW